MFSLQSLCSSWFLLQGFLTPCFSSSPGRPRASNSEEEDTRY